MGSRRVAGASSVTRSLHMSHEIVDISNRTKIEVQRSTLRTWPLCTLMLETHSRPGPAMQPTRITTMQHHMACTAMRSAAQTRTLGISYSRDSCLQLRQWPQPEQSRQHQHRLCLQKTGDVLSTVFMVTHNDMSGL